MEASLRERFERIRPIEQMEVTLVRSLVDRPGWIKPPQMAALRYALNLASLCQVPTGDGDVVVEDSLAGFQHRIIEVLQPLLLDTGGVVERHALLQVLPLLMDFTARTRTDLLRRNGARMAEHDLDLELCQKALVVVAGGGGGSGYVYIGAFKLLDDMGLRPSLIVGSSMGSIIGLFRAAREQFDLDLALRITEGMKWRDVFLMPAMSARYGLPATLRLYLRRTIAEHFQDQERGRTLRLGELHIPLRVVVAGLARSGLSHELDYYEHLMDDFFVKERASMRVSRHRLRGLGEVIGEFIKRGRGVKEIVLGGDSLTDQFDVVDAVGFSSAVPGLIHYDIWRDDEHMHDVMHHLFERHNLVSLVDGGLVNNVPARVAWLHVQRGDIGTRNTFILAMDCFAPQILRNLMVHPIQRLVRPQVMANAPFAHFSKRFQHVPSPLELLPDVGKLSAAIRNGYRELSHDRAFIREMLRPITGLDWSAAGGVGDRLIAV